MVFLIPFRTGWRTQRFGTFDFWSQSSHDHLGFLKMGLPQFQLIIIYYHHVPSIFPLDYRSCALCIPHFQAAIAAWALDALRSLNGETLMGPKSQQAEVGLNEIKTFWVSPIGQFVWSLWYIYNYIYIGHSIFGVYSSFDMYRQHCQEDGGFQHSSDMRLWGFGTHLEFSCPVVEMRCPTTAKRNLQQP